jgi:ABC-type glycerol-3-phosphate transport system substrate-binding protein
MTWSCYQLGEARQRLWDETFQLAGQATKIKINVLWEPGQGHWDKRQAEAAAGSAPVDAVQDW